MKSKQESRCELGNWDRYLVSDSFLLGAGVTFYLSYKEIVNIVKSLAF